MKDIDKIPDPVINLFKDVSRIAGYLWNKEWAERNAGNISIDISEYFEPGELPAGCGFFPFSFPGEAANLTLFDPAAEYVFTENMIRSKSKNSPFIGKQLKGKAVGIINNGKLQLNG